MMLICMKQILMRRLAGLLYIDSKTMGDIKDKIKKETSNDLYS